MIGSGEGWPWTAMLPLAETWLWLGSGWPCECVVVMYPSKDVSMSSMSSMSSATRASTELVASANEGNSSSSRAMLVHDTCST